MSRKDRKREEPAAASAPRTRRITPVDIQQKEFRLALRGYSEHEVDEFLDQVTEEVARLTSELKRAQEDAEYKRTVPLSTDAAAEAEAMLARARDEAARILADADRMATEIRSRGADGTLGGVPVVGAGGAAPTPGPLAGRFLTREREFLQSLAGLIQRHAEAVKDDVRTHRQAMEAEPPAEPAGSADDVPGTAGPVMAPPQDSAGDDAPTLVAPQEREATPDPGRGEASDRPQEPPPTATLDLADLAPTPSARAIAEPDEDAGQDRSIRELFWGED